MMRRERSHLLHCYHVSKPPSSPSIWTSLVISQPVSGLLPYPVSLSFIHPPTLSPPPQDSVFFTQNYGDSLQNESYHATLPLACRQSRVLPVADKALYYLVPDTSQTSFPSSALLAHLAFSMLASLQLEPHLSCGFYTCPSLCLGSSSLNCLLLNFIQVFAHVFLLSRSAFP